MHWGYVTNLEKCKSQTRDRTDQESFSQCYQEKQVRTQMAVGLGMYHMDYGWECTDSWTWIQRKIELNSSDTECCPSWLLVEICTILMVWTYTNSSTDPQMIAVVFQVVDGTLSIGAWQCSQGNKWSDSSDQEQWTLDLILYHGLIWLLICSSDSDSSDYVPVEDELLCPFSQLVLCLFLCCEHSSLLWRGECECWSLCSSLYCKVYQCLVQVHS